jgi:hypothetical protein
MTRFEFDNLPSLKFGILLCVCVFVVYLTDPLATGLQVIASKCRMIVKN